MFLWVSVSQHNWLLTSGSFDCDSKASKYANMQCVCVYMHIKRACVYLYIYI